MNRSTTRRIRTVGVAFALAAGASIAASTASQAATVSTVSSAKPVGSGHRAIWGTLRVAPTSPQMGTHRAIWGK